MTPISTKMGTPQVSLRLVAFGSIALIAASIGAAAAVATPSPSRCRVDPATGLTVSQGVSGVCIAMPEEQVVLTQRSEDGLLIATFDSRAQASPFPAGDRGPLSVQGVAARIVFCPTRLLEFATGAPTAACLADGRTLQPGPGALAGAGTVRANLRFDGAGETRCPAAARIAASVSSAEGRRFDLTGSIAMLDESGRPDSCAITYDRIELTRGAAVDAPSEAGETEPGDGASRIDRLMQLDEEQWKVVDLLLALTPGDWNAVEAVAGKGSGLEVPLPPAEAAALPDIINTILSRVNAIRSNLDSVSSRIPDRADVRNLLGQVELGRLRDMLGEVRDTLQGFVDIARELREGYDTFDVAQFRARLGGVLTDLESASSLYQRLLCADDPDIPIHQISLTPLRRLIDRAPGVVLYALSKILDAIDAGWDQRIGSAVDAVPSEVTGLCNDALRPAAVRQRDATNVLCNVLRPKEVGTELSKVKVEISIGLMLFRFAKNNTKEEIQATVGATAVAGGTAGASVKNPAYETLSQWVDRLDNLKDALKDLIDRRKDCLDADIDIENDLRDCAKDECTCLAPLTVFLPGVAPPTYTYVADLVVVRIGQAEDAGLSNAADARTKYDLAIDAEHDETADGYRLLCQAYRDLLTSTVGAPGVPVQPRQRPSVRSSASRTPSGGAATQSSGPTSRRASPD